MTDLDHGADLRERLDRVMRDLPAPDGLTAAALTDGRRLRRRRRILTAASGVAGVAALTALVTASLGGGTPSTGPQVATQPPAPTGGPAPTPHDGGGADPFSDLPTGWWDAPEDRLLTQLEAALPDGVTITAHDPEEAIGSILASLAAPAGPGGFQIILSMPDLEAIPDPVTTTDAAGNEGTAMLAEGPSNVSRVKCGHQARYADNCEEILDADGEAVGRLTSLLQDGTITFYEATLLGPDGGLVYMSAWNATDEKPGPDTLPSAPAPPLTIEQLRALVQDPAWTSYEP